MGTEITLVFWPPNAPTLFSIALDAAERLSGVPLRAGGQQDALISLVFAAASLEAFLNEVGYLAGGKNSFRAPEPATVIAFAQVMEEAEESRATIQSKFQLGSLALTGKTYDKGSAPFQEFSDLIAVRNLLMHGKSNERFSRVDNEPVLLNPVSVIDRLSHKHILHEAAPEHLKGFVAIAGESSIAEVLRNDELEGASPKAAGGRMMTRWTYVVGTRAAAEWACTTASRIALDLIDKAPTSRWKEMMEAQFRKPFTAPFCV